MPYREFYTEEFYARLVKYRHFKSLIENKIALLLEDPYRNCKSELLMGNLKGLRSARVTRSVRIIYAICEECRRRGWQKFTACSPAICKKLGAETVIFLTLGTHQDVYE